jgi:hypothetical protein
VKDTIVTYKWAAYVRISTFPGSKLPSTFGGESTFSILRRSGEAASSHAKDGCFARLKSGDRDEENQLEPLNGGHFHLAGAKPEQESMDILIFKKLGWIMFFVQGRWSREGDVQIIYLQDWGLQLT